MKRIAVLAVAVVVAGNGVATSAATMTTTTVDLRRLTFSPTTTYGIQGGAFTPISVALGAGDTFDFTIDFKGSQTLALTGPTSFWAYAYIAPGQLASDVTGTGTLSLLDASGAAFLTSTVKTDTEGSVHFGQSFRSTEFSGLQSAVTFSGLHYVGTVDSYADPRVTVRTYTAPAFYVDAASAVVLGTVPEPASWALLVVGFGLIGTAARRRVGRASISC